MSPHELINDPVAYQRSLCPPEVLAELDRSRVPTPDRFFRVAAGLAEWTPQEQEIIQADQSLMRYEQEMKAQVEAIFGSRPASQSQKPSATADETVVETAHDTGAAAVTVVVAIRHWVLSLRRKGLLAETARPYYEFESDEMTAWLYPRANPADRKWTIQIVRGKPSGEIQLFAGTTEIPLEEGFEGEYATVRYPDIQSLLTRNEKLLVRIKKDRPPATGEPQPSIGGASHELATNVSSRQG
jgi:hypothetical protein